MSLTNRQIQILRYIKIPRECTDVMYKFDISSCDRLADILSLRDGYFLFDADTDAICDEMHIWINDIGAAELELQDREDELQLLRDKRAVRRSWIQLFAAAILGALVTKLIDWIPAVITWLSTPPAK